MSEASQSARPVELTAQVGVHPSSAVRPVPSFVFAVPAGWALDDVPQTVAALRAPEPVDGFLVNVVIAHERVAASVDHRQAAQSTWIQLLRECPGATSGMERMVTFGERETYLRSAEFPAPQSGRPLAQLQALCFAPSAPDAKVADLFQIICTCPPPVAEQYGPSFLEVIGSLRFT